MLAGGPGCDGPGPGGSGPDSPVPGPGQRPDGPGPPASGPSGNLLHYLRHVGKNILSRGVEETEGFGSLVGGIGTTSATGSPISFF